MEFMNKLGLKLKEEIANEIQIIHLLDEAAFTERFISKPKPPHAPSMYDLITTSYSEDEVGYYKKELKMRATPRQLTRWDFSIDVLLMIKPDISKDPIFDRKLVWLRANRFKWSKIARFLGSHRTTLKLRYDNLIQKLAKKVKDEIKFDKLNRILYLI
jgi:hypothetical protein|tara:strand:- start:481 stop:954 length:474 start_codon:yes stop_codon:yes gene_type:complete